MPLECSHPLRNGGERVGRVELPTEDNIKHTVSIEHLPVSGFLTAKYRGVGGKIGCFAGERKQVWKGKNN